MMPPESMRNKQADIYDKWTESYSQKCLEIAMINSQDQKYEEDLSQMSMKAMYARDGKLDVLLNEFVIRTILQRKPDGNTYVV